MMLSFENFVAFGSRTSITLKVKFEDDNGKEKFLDLTYDVIAVGKDAVPDETEFNDALASCIDNFVLKMALNEHFSLFKAVLEERLRWVLSDAESMMEYSHCLAWYSVLNLQKLNQSVFIF